MNESIHYTSALKNMNVKIVRIFFGVSSMLQSMTLAAPDQVLSRSLAACPTGAIADKTGKFCCPASCKTCGGFGCEKRNGGAKSCCTSQIKESCNSSGPPCTASNEITSYQCPAGGILDASGTTCCKSSCIQCDGPGCHLRNGSGSSCCANQIKSSCSAGKLPCILSKSEMSGCPFGGVLDASGKVCCSGSCGTCGGNGCNKRKGGAAKCCTSKISASCDAGKLPCVIADNSPTPMPTRKPSGRCASNVSAFISYNVSCDVEVCCSESCEVCDTSEQCTAEPECCAYKIAEGIWKTDVVKSCRNHKPPCVVPPVDDLCISDNPCQQGARCGYAWQGTYELCNPVIRCECEEVGNFAGQYCELECGAREMPCGYFANDIETNTDSRNNICCLETEYCLPADVKYGTHMECFPRKWMVKCDTNPCKNGGECIHMYTDGIPQDSTFMCLCPPGFESGLCEL